MASGGAGSAEKEVESVDSEEIVITAKIGDEMLEKQYRVRRSNGEELDLRLFHQHGLGPDRIIGHRYRLENIELVTKPNKRYLRNTETTSISDITQTDAATDLMVVGDTHIGYRHRPAYDRHTAYTPDACRKAFKNLIEGSIQHGIDGIVHTGDLYDHEATADDYQWVKAGINRLAEADIGFVFIRGNHDPSAPTAELAELANVMHIGDGATRQFAGFDFIGYDHDLQQDLTDLDFTGFTDPTCLIIHPEETDQNHTELTESVDDIATRCYVFAGHHHTFDTYTTENVQVVFTGSPAGLNYAKRSTAYRVRFLNGLLSDHTACSLR